MSTEANKMRFDPIPVLPPGIAPPLPTESKPSTAVTKPTAPPSKSTDKPSDPKPASSSSAVPEWLKGVFAPSKNKGVVAVAAVSLLAGWYGVRTIFPPAPKAETVAEGKNEVQPFVSTVTPDPSATSIPVPPLVPTPSTGFQEPVAVPIIPEAGSKYSAKPITLPEINLDPIPITPATTTLPKTQIPVPEFMVPVPDIRNVGHQETPVTVPSATGTDLKITPVIPSVIVPAAGSGPAASPQIVLPAIPGVTAPSAPDKKVEAPHTPTPLVSIPNASDPKKDSSLPGSTLPFEIPSATGAGTSPPSTTSTPVVPPLSIPETGGTSLITPDLNLKKPPTATVPTVVPIPSPSVPVPTLPVTPMSPAPSYIPPVTPPATTPATIKQDPQLLTVGSTGTTVEAKTDFDVDLHYPKTGETYASIAKLHYGDEKYASVLAQFNQMVNRGNSSVIQVPPTWWVKKQMGAPAARPTSTPTSNRDDWTPASATTASTYHFYTIPTTTNGMTFKEIAKQAYGTELDWQRVFDLNSSYPADSVLPAGTKIRLTGDAKLGQ